MSLADQLTLARAAAVPLVIALFVWDFEGHNWWATSSSLLRGWPRAC